MQIDTSTIANFETMTAEQKLDALLNMELPEPDYTGYVKKDLYDRAASDLAAAKKQLKGKLSDDDRAAAERQEELETLRNQIEDITKANQQLQQEKMESAYKAKYLAMAGFDEKLAEETAKAMASGQMDKVFANMQKANEAHAKELKAQFIKEDPKPGGTGGEDEEPDNVAAARAIGKRKAEAMKASENVFEKYKL